MESELAFHDDNFGKFHVPRARTSDACALETRQQFVTERRKKKGKRKRKPKPRPHCLGKKTGQHACKRDAMGQFYSIYAQSRALFYQFMLHSAEAGSHVFKRDT